jgi:hypothetical protein
MTEPTFTNLSHPPLATTSQDAPALATWESPEAIEIDLGSAKTANTNSNFDGTNYSS